MKELVFCLMLICMAVTARSQSPDSSSKSRQCTLSVSQAPEIRGIRLGMSTDKLLAVFPGAANQVTIENALRSAKRPESYGVARFSFDRTPNASNPNFANVNDISVTLLDERVAAFNVNYEGPEWKSAEQFISRLADAFHLIPVEYWDGTPGGANRTLKCDGFEVHAFSGGGNTISNVGLNIPSAWKTVEDRREAAKEKVRAAFKP